MTGFRVRPPVGIVLLDPTYRLVLFEPVHRLIKAVLDPPFVQHHPVEYS